ncbi:MAG: DUF3120 domain-containing protein [Jaaginema sp. PMC 1079.18]|nr:DUF3120 domain-containing protein [Jaaginema sp. PMC 1079.18]
MSSLESCYRFLGKRQRSQLWLMFGVSAFLVSIPVFAQAPLVRQWPWISLMLTGFWLALGGIWQRSPKYQVWGDLTIGFSWSWLAGSIYWGWFRSEPLIHLPIEAIALPLALWSLSQNQTQYRVGNFFYLGSLLGTAITDIYFYLNRVIPYWREVMEVEPSEAIEVLHQAWLQVQTPWGLMSGLLLAGVLLGIGLRSLQQQNLHWWAFGGAVLSTILVDGLFGFAIALT